MSEKANWFTKHPITVTEMQREYAAKISANRAAGLKKFESGKYTPFTGFPVKKFSKICDFTLELDPQSQLQIAERVVNPLQELAKKYEISAIFPNKGDQPVHVAFENGLFPANIPEEQIKFVIQWLESSKSHIGRISKILTKLTFKHDTLVMAAPTSYICAGEFGNEQGSIYRARMAIETIMGKAAGKLENEFGEGAVSGIVGDKRYHDIFHTSVMRITREVPASQLIPFAQEAYATIGEDLKREPLQITVSSVYVGRASDFHKTNAPWLVVP